jgi:hypothetical protein
MAESSNSFLRSKFIYANRNETFRLVAALICSQQVKHLSEKLFNSEDTKNTLENEKDSLTYN